MDIFFTMHDKCTPLFDIEFVTSGMQGLDYTLIFCVLIYVPCMCNFLWSVK